uniref:SPRY domain-containing protein n=1 Tax=Romanomermis culicivorax TaxID=13658 RepID=A0A915HG77_ROMCU
MAFKCAEIYKRINTWVRIAANFRICDHLRFTVVNETYCMIGDEDFLIDENSYIHVDKVFDEDTVLLDPYDADLNIRLTSDDHLSAESLSQDGFSFMLASIKATHGFKRGKIAFQLKITNVIDVSNQRLEETHTPEIRVGVSIYQPSAHLRLGESSCSYGYCNNGKKSNNSQFSKYSSSFGEIGDVVTVLLDLETNMQISFYTGDVPENLDLAFRLSDQWDFSSALFPHDSDANWPRLPEGYVYVNDLPPEDKHRFMSPAVSKQDCSVMCMIGLPGSGKTSWVRSFLKDQPPQQNWYILSAYAILDQMKVGGVSRKKIHQGRWDLIMGAVVKCLTRMILLACRLKRNYILDMTNCYPLPRRKKMTPFIGFKRLAYVVVPGLEDYANRCHQQIMSEGKQMPSDAILEMKACFVLPDDNESDVFDEIHYVELPKVQAQKVVEFLNEEGKAFKPREKKRRGDWYQEDLPPEMLKKYKTSVAASTSSVTNPIATVSCWPSALATTVASTKTVAATMTCQSSAIPTTAVSGAAASDAPLFITNRPATNERPAWLAQGAAAMGKKAPGFESQSTPAPSPAPSRTPVATPGPFTPRAGWPASWPQALWRGGTPVTTTSTTSVTPAPQFSFPPS